MGRKKLDILGQRFGNLIVESFAYVHNAKSYWHCICDCGNKTTVRGNRFNYGTTTSCGCARNGNKNSTTHGLSYHPLYKTWEGMMARCNNVKHSAYKDYGGRGIKVCKRWLDVQNFIDDMFITYKWNLTLDRIDNNKGYNKSNCRWATQLQQARNRRKRNGNQGK